ncbi:ABC transporter permease [Neokomagataea thailandica NBRC 106555]|uniref:ABC transporter permease n=2 Tax=Neokomagataea TaxID=1223423 RepID=A0A4Y6V6V5_9PROT|nr:MULTISPECIES: ABC transporter permease [Neokomagataea]QDH24276.1 ABC transporter permease [Neokomagataea tanensis]GBR53011.1 ABC transporter permease [Neokomagataea thailandica NBRC 106555]
MNMFRTVLAGAGRFSRAQGRFTLMAFGTGWGVLREALIPSSWRRTVRIEFWKTLKQATKGALVSVFVTAALTGFGIVAQAVYWLGFAGIAQLTGSILSTVLVREIAPVLVGVILLGRSGMLTLTELGTLTIGGEMRVLTGMGVDPFLVFILPRSLAMMVSGFTLGMVFSITALLFGYIVCRVEGVLSMPVWTFFDQVVSSVHAVDYISIPGRLIISGFAIGITSCLTGMDATADDDLASLLPRGFARGMLAVMGINVLFTVLVG